MVGTFYRAPAPGSAPFVAEGDAVAPGQTLCILEAMKLMNEVKAEVEGVIRAIHVGNAEPVEYGQLLFELEPVNGRPLDAVSSRVPPRPRREPGRDRRPGDPRAARARRRGRRHLLDR
jgi:pyruvate/2-oxoglutarate dehydrogenase complex dihydrolipoamide acyltransferase (E2) component